MATRFDNQGQIVEILANAKIYDRPIPTFDDKKSELIWQSKFPDYDLFDGILIGGHSGIENFKIGQRKGISKGGNNVPLYIIKIDRKEKRIFVGAGKEHPGLQRKVYFFSKNDFEFSDGFEFNDDKNYFDAKVLLTNQNDVLNGKIYIYEEGLFLEFSQTLSLLHENQNITIIKNNNKIATATIKY